MDANWQCQLNAASKNVPSTATVPGRCFPFTSSILPLDKVYDGPSNTGLKVERFGCASIHRRVWDEVEKIDDSNPCESDVRDKYGTLTSAIDSCRQLGIVEDEKVFQVALGSTGAIESRRKLPSKKDGVKKKRKRLAPRGRRGNPNKRGKSDTDHLRKDPKYRALMASMEN